MIIITGASDGLGAEILLAAGRNKFQTMNISRRKNPNATLNVEADLSTLEGVEVAVDAMRKAPKPTTLILNAGVFSLQKLTDITADEYGRVMDINLRAPILIISKLYDWIRDNSVDIVIINSIAGMQSFTNQSLYDASKWALRGFTNDLRMELVDTKCRVLGVYPGMLDTNIAGKLPSGPLPKSRHPLIPVTEVADIILASILQPKSMEMSDTVINRKK